MSDDILHFEGLPFWRGVTDEPQRPEILPFTLDLDPRGFLRQGADAELRERIARIYARDDYSFITPPPGASAWADALGNAKVAKLLEYCPTLDGMDVLEIGAGSLHVAAALTKRFATRSYVAVDPALGEPPRPGIEVVRDFFPAERLGARKFDLIVAFSCLEHVDDPVLFLSACRAVLEPEAAGIFFVAPDVGAALRAGDLGILVHEHLSYFDDIGLHNAFAAAALGIERLSSAKGVFYGLAEPAPARRPADPQGLAAIAPGYGKTVHLLGRKIRDEIDGGLRLGFHGANPNLNNFLWLTGLAGDSRVAVFDNDKAKWGRYLPTCLSPVRSPADPDYDHLDRLYVAATSFYAEIRAGMIERGVAADRIQPLHW